MKQKIDQLIVGGGISGRLLQLAFIKQGQSTLVVDEPNSNHCSIVAAGLANPVIGKYFSVGWRADDLFSPLSSIYEDIEKRLNTSFFSPTIFKRVIATAGEQNLWLSKAHLAKYNAFCEYVNEDIAGLNTDYGILKVSHGGQMNTRAFLSACSTTLTTRSELFNYTDLDLASNTYGDISFRHIVFCEGHKITENDLFNTIVDVIPTKGELLEIEMDLENKQEVYLGPVFIQNISGKKWRIGSTYHPNDASLHPTEEKREELSTRLKKILKIPYRIVDHYCGVRPASSDRKPMLGVHPMHGNVFVFNGMGSKAVSMAPVLANEMVNFVLHNKELHPETNIQRFC